MRSFDATFATEILKTHTQPVLLLQVDTGGGMKYYSDRTITVASQVYTPAVTNWGSIVMMFGIPQVQTSAGIVTLQKTASIISSIHADKWENADISILLHFVKLLSCL